MTSELWRKRLVKTLVEAILVEEGSLEGTKEPGPLFLGGFCGGGSLSMDKSIKG